MASLPHDLAARYAVERTLGEGGFGSVLLARDLHLDRPVALKRLHAAFADPEVRARFEREARVTAGLAHPHVVEVYDHGVAEDGRPYIVYAFVDGRSLEDRIAEEVSTREVVRWAGELAGALEHAHRAGVVHRDVKPENVLIRAADGAAVLCDFGVARTSREGTMRTADDLVLGSPPFMAPELWRGATPSPASDQFGWGATLFAALGGGSVFGVERTADILSALSSYRPPEMPPVTPSELGPTLRRALASTPEERYASMAEVRAALARGEQSDAGTRRVSMPVEELPRAARTAVLAGPGAEPPARRRRLGALVVVAMGVVVAAAAWRSAGDPPPPLSSEDRGPDRARVAESWTRLEGARDRLLAHLELAQGAPTWEDILHDLEPEDLVEPLADARTPLTWTRYIEGVGGWWDACAEAGALPDAERSSRVLRFGAHFLRSYNRFIEYFAREIARGNLIADHHALQVNGTFMEIRKRSNEWIDLQEERPGALLSVARAYQVRLGVRTEHPELEAYVDRLLATPLDALPPAYDGLLLDALSEYLAGDEGMRPTVCPRLPRLREAFRARVMRQPADAQRALRCRVGWGLRMLEIRRQDPCGDGRLDLTRYQQLLVEAEVCAERSAVREWVIQSTRFSAEQDALVAVEFLRSQDLSGLRALVGAQRAALGRRIEDARGP